MTALRNTTTDLGIYLHIYIYIYTLVGTFSSLTSTTTSRFSTHLPCGKLEGKIKPSRCRIRQLPLWMTIERQRKICTALPFRFTLVQNAKIKCQTNAISLVIQTPTDIGASTHPPGIISTSRSTGKKKINISEKRGRFPKTKKKEASKLRWKSNLLLLFTEVHHISQAT